MGLPADQTFKQAAGVDLPVVAINLPHRTDRWHKLVERMSVAGLDNLIRAPAVDGAKLPTAQIAALLDEPSGPTEDAPRSHLSLTRPAVGCFLSHLAVWRWLIDSGLPRVLVLEDDAAPVQGYSAARLRTVVETLPVTAGLTFFGRILMHGLAERHTSAGLARMYYFNGTFAYTITPKAAQFLLRHLFPLQFHIDHQISRLLVEKRHEFAAYCVEPPLLEPDWSLRSDCYVPIADDTAADRELGRQFEAARQALLAEGRPLLPLAG